MGVCLIREIGSVRGTTFAVVCCGVAILFREAYGRRHPGSCRLAVSPLSVTSSPAGTQTGGTLHHVWLGGSRVLHVLRLRQQPAKGEAAAGKPHGEVLLHRPTEGNADI